MYWKGDKVTGQHGKELQAAIEKALFAELERIDLGVIQRAVGRQTA